MDLFSLKFKKTLLIIGVSLIIIPIINRLLINEGNIIIGVLFLLGISFLIFLCILLFIQSRKNTKLAIIILSLGLLSLYFTDIIIISFLTFIFATILLFKIKQLDKKNKVLIIIGLLLSLYSFLAYIFIGPSMLKNIKYEHKVQEIKQIISDEDLFNRKKECASLQEEIKGYMNSQKYEWQGLKVYYSPVLDTCMYTFKSKINWDETWHHSWMLYDYLNGNERIFGGTGCQSIYEVGFEEECRKAEEEMDIIINQYTKNDNSYPEITWMSIGKKTDGRNVVNWSFEDGRYKSAWNCYNECKMIVKDSNFLGKALFSEDMPTPNGCDTWFNVSKDNSKLMNNISNICINIQCINGKQTREFCFGKK